VPSAFYPVGSAPVLPNGTQVPLSPAFRVQSVLYLSGQLAFDASGKLVESDIVAQTRQCLENIEALLRVEGVDRSSIIKTTVWLVDAQDFQAFNNEYSAFFGDHRPARSTVRSDLLLPGALVEIEAIAYLKE